MSKGASFSYSQYGVDFINVTECKDCIHTNVCKFKESMNKAWENLSTNSIANVPAEIKMHCKYASYSATR